ncbi:MAG TPA: efflux RND transporter periplasmic adaptor subunit [Verrucomicrobiae bacterium]|nr:efflux RND transporter periplasmic adaptor subunit [Verrucomicrobiae bacterium]
MKWIFTLILLAAIGGFGWWYYQSKHETPAEYQTAAVTRGDLTQAVTATGQLGPVLNVQVGSQISGIVKKLFADFNSVVKSNQVIAEIDPSTYDLNVLKAQAGLANSKANLTLAEVQARRADELYTNHLISAADHDIASAQMLQAKAQVQSDEATLKNAQVQLSYCTIYAPVDGVVISRNVDVGQTVAASFNTPTLFLIANDLAKMQIDALVSEADIGNAAVGQNVNFSVDAFPYRTFKGRVSQIRYGAITNQNVINYDCVIEVKNDDLKLLPGMTANVSIIIAERNSALKIPNAALRFRPPESAGLPASTNSGPGFASQGLRGGGPGGEGGGGGFRQRGGEGGGPGGFGGGPRGPGGGEAGQRARPRADRQTVRTVYVLSSDGDPKNGASPKLKPVQVKTGITDGISTEVLEGLEEGMQVVTGTLSSGDNGSRPAANPFGGGPFRRF